MPGTIRVGRPNRISHIPLSWDVTKARSNHEPKFRPVGDAVLRGRERSVGQVMEEMFASMPPIEPIIAGEMDVAGYLAGAMEVAEPYRVRIAEILQPTFNEGALLGQDRIRADVNDQLRRLGSPLRLTDADGDVTKATADPQMVGGVRVGRSPKAEWASVGVEAFDSVNAASVEYAQFRSGTLVTAMVEEQQRVIQNVIGESFTAQQTFRPVGDFPARTVTGLTAQQTSQALVTVLQDVNPTTPVGQNLARFRGVNMNGLTQPWERAVYHRAERMADALAKQGVTGVKAQMKIQRGAQAHANKLRRSRARMISRTEIKRAQVHGQLTAMRQAVSDGLADPRTAGKKWVTGATDVCNVCSDLGFGKPILLDQSFHGVGDGPPAHPNCRCDLDFAHTLSSAPIPHGAAGPNSPYRPGTPENPIVWEFPSGFKTSPSATRAFTPPGFTPPVPPPAAVTPPAQPSAPVEVPVRPAETLPSSNAEIVWDDAGRKWADLTDDERWFLYKGHTEDLVRQAYDDASGVIISEVNPLATRPPLADDASDAIKDIYRQIDRVDDLKLQEARHTADQQLFFTDNGQFNPGTVFADNMVTWADEGYVAGTEARLASRARIVDAGSDGMSLPGSTRRLIFESDTGRDLLDPDGPLRVRDLQDAVLRVIKSQDDLASSVIAELETEVTKLGAMIRTDAVARVGGDVAAEIPQSWVTTQFPKGVATKDDVAALAAKTQKLDVQYNTLRQEADEFLYPAEARGLPARSLQGRRPRFDTPADELEYLSIWEPLETSLGQAVNEGLASVANTMSGLDDAAAITRRVEIMSKNVEGRLRGAYDPIDEAVKLLDEAVSDLRTTFPDAFAARPSTEKVALELFQPDQGTLSPGSLMDLVERRLYGQSVRATGKRHAKLIPDEELAETVTGQVVRFYEFRGNQKSYALEMTKSRLQASLLEKTHELAKVLEAGDVAGANRLLLGQLSRVSEDTGQVIREAINEVLREVRLIGGEKFSYERGLTIGGREGFKVMSPRVKQALDSMEEGVEKWMPADWVTRSNRRGNLGFYGDKSRASYLDSSHTAATSGKYTSTGDGLIDIGRNATGEGAMRVGGGIPDSSTMLHEVTHRAQRASPLHEELELAWWRRRVDATVDPVRAEVRKLSDIYPLKNYDGVEVAAEDEFLNAYIGKIYNNDRASETSAMAMEHVAGLEGFSGQALGADLDMVDWWVGMLAGV